MLSLACLILSASRGTCPRLLLHHCWRVADDSLSLSVHRMLWRINAGNLSRQTGEHSEIWYGFWSLCKDAASVTVSSLQEFCLKQPFKKTQWPDSRWLEQCIDPFWSKTWQDPIVSFLIMCRLEEEDGKKINKFKRKPEVAWSVPWRASIKAKALVQSCCNECWRTGTKCP